MFRLQFLTSKTCFLFFIFYFWTLQKPKTVEYLVKCIAIIILPFVQLEKQNTLTTIGVRIY